MVDLLQMRMLIENCVPWDMCLLGLFLGHIAVFVCVWLAICFPLLSNCNYETKEKNNQE